ncbi:MAG: hypothetical protein RDV48_26865 [Candidatus Eremiobacteraeota bacterium]|nr:hypothetical protein [Candidatus Eremiobacteraeota bacterium]
METSIEDLKAITEVMNSRNEGGTLGLVLLGMGCATFAALFLSNPGLDLAKQGALMVLAGIPALGGLFLVAKACFSDSGNLSAFPRDRVELLRELVRKTKSLRPGSDENAIHFETAVRTRMGGSKFWKGMLDDQFVFFAIESPLKIVIIKPDELSISKSGEFTPWYNVEISGIGTFGTKLGEESLRNYNEWKERREKAG